MTHECHATGCSDEAHPEIPFCKRHFGMLPEAHRKKLWSGRPKDKVCGACDPGHSQAAPLIRRDGWDDLYILGVAILLVIEYDDCGAPPELHDEQGFCWMCGMPDAARTYKRAERVVERFKLKG